MIAPCSTAINEYVFSYQHPVYEFSTSYNELPLIFLVPRAMQCMLVKDNVGYQKGTTFTHLLQDCMILYYIILIEWKTVLKMDSRVWQVDHYLFI